MLHLIEDGVESGVERPGDPAGWDAVIAGDLSEQLDPDDPGDLLLDLPRSEFLALELESQDRE